METPIRQNARTIARNVAYAALTWILPVLLSLIATPIIVRSLGVDNYGIYALVLGLISYSFSFGIGRAATKYVAEYRASGASENIRRLISATLLLSVGIGLLGLIVLSLLADWLVSDVLLIDVASKQTSINAIYIAGAVIFVASLNQVFASVLQGIHRFDLYSKLFNANSFALLSGNLILAYLGFGLTTLLTWNLITLAMSTIAFAVAAMRTVQEISLNPLSASRDSIHTVFRYSVGIIGYQVLANGLLLFERGWITRTLGTDSLTYYAVAMSIGVYIHGFASSLLMTVAPLTSETHRDNARLLALYEHTTKLIAAIVLLLATVAAFGHREFLALWLGDDFAVRSGLLLVIHVVTFALNAILGVSWLMREGLGVPKHNVYIFSVCFLVSISLMIVLVDPFGLLGVAIARFVGFTVIFASAFQFEYWLFGRVQTRTWLRNGSIFVAAISAAGAVELVVLRFLPLTWVSFAAAAIAAGSVYCLVLWALNLATSDEKMMIRRIAGK